MDSVIFCGHPTIEESASHQFLKAASPSQVPFIEIYGHLDDEEISDYQAMILAKERIFLQFPLFWYQAPGVVSDFIRLVFSKEFLDVHHQELKGKELGVIISIGLPEKHYQAGGREGVTLSELLRPYESFSRSLGFTYLPPFVLAQHHYQSDRGKERQLVAFRQHLALPRNPNFQQRSQWLHDQLSILAKDFVDPQLSHQLTLLADEWQEALDDLGDLESQLPQNQWR
ncbi:NAD(P)H-dependent oxidoreductase [Aerococcus kribbianus]|uniref:NAD(P)H-dependent oxidoreductase n=1 Tax=Aerococcus kribbianus TaxID=2999064 RepID=A0A9X3JDB6_9LACT|nr:MULTISPECIES: NAD(P)H-dependent oxidoreductase [unclassified Aerococcus]MCZ0717320.1 NAD(P)H-dependent oxidoreductase [Aerococcus sp. YH-aer221]MCZ0725608.1 NAD(P)H-dependent oxidoreductase [Aerococcus sp. YH-aer222]